MLIKLYETYNKVKDVFKKPVLKFKACKWQDSPLLPVWRSGPTICLGKYGEYTDKYHFARLESSEWNDVGKKNHPILSKFFKPKYQLPVWLSFYVFNHDMIWKTKWSEYRFEYPPQFSIVIFGYSFNWWLTSPGTDSQDYDYWESILYYLYEYKDDPDWKEKVTKRMGNWIVNYGKENETSRPAFNQEAFLK